MYSIYTKLNDSKKGGEKMKFDRKSGIEGITPKGGHGSSFVAHECRGSFMV